MIGEQVVIELNWELAAVLLHFLLLSLFAQNAPLSIQCSHDLILFYLRGIVFRLILFYA